MLVVVLKCPEILIRQGLLESMMITTAMDALSLSLSNFFLLNTHFNVIHTFGSPLVWFHWYCLRCLASFSSPPSWPFAGSSLPRRRKTRHGALEAQCRDAMKRHCLSIVSTAIKRRWLSDHVTKQTRCKSIKKFQYELLLKFFTCSRKTNVECSVLGAKKTGSPGTMDFSLETIRKIFYLKFILLKLYFRKKCCLF